MAKQQPDGELGSRWAIVAQVVTALGDELSLEGLVGRALGPALAILGADAAGIHIVDRSSGRLDLVAELGLPPELVDEIARVPLDAPATGAAQPDDGLLDPQPGLQAVKGLASRHGFRGFGSVPLRGHGQLVGALSFLTRRRRRFDPSDIAIVEVVAHALASGILNASALESERRMRQALEAVDAATLAISAEREPSRVLQAIVDQAREVTGARYAALGIGVDPEKPFDPWVYSGVDAEQARLIGPHPRPVGLLGAVLAEGKAIRLREIEADPRFRGWPAQHPRVTSFLGVPIRLGGEPIGNLYLADQIETGEFSVEDERAVESLAAHAAVAYRHAQLYEQVRAERHRLRALVESSPLAIIFVEHGGHVYANPAAVDLFGRQIEPQLGAAQYLAQFKTSEGLPLIRAELPSSRALLGEHVTGMEVVLVRPDGREVPVIVNAAPITGARGEIGGAVVLFQDISPLKLEQLREEFISMVAHELRTPISVIAGYADLLSRGQHDASERRALDAIRVGARRLERMVRDLLDISRIEARRLDLQPEAVDVAGLVEEVVGRIGELLAGRTVRRSAVGNPPSVPADPVRIEQVLTNLLTNAAKYSPAGSEIAVVVEELPGEVSISISNPGPGIPPDDLPRLFSRFYRTAAARGDGTPGLGLGLYVSRGLVEAHGGRIWVTSAPGQQVTFSFALPVVRAEAQRGKASGKDGMSGTAAEVGGGKPRQITPESD